MADPKVGIYICKGCEIGQSLDIDQLIKESESDKLPVCKTNDILCSKEAVQEIKDDIEKEGLNRIVIAACSARLFPELFEFGKDVFTDRVNLREYVTWTHPANDEDTQMLAEDYVRMGIAKVKAGETPEPYTEEISRDIMVVGGGMAGLTAAKAAAEAGYKVVLVEKEDKLGGWATKFHKVFPKTPPYQELTESGYEELIKAVEGNDNITVHKSTLIEKTSGQPGKLEVTLASNGNKTELLIGSIIQATGWKPYDPKNLEYLGYGISPDVVTNTQMEEMASNGGLKRPSNGQPIESIAFIQCAGSRDQDHLPYCSAVCCRVSLKQAMYVREQYPDARVYIIYKDVRTPAQYEMFYAHVQDDDNIFMTKGEIDSVTKAEDGSLLIDVKETLLGEDIQVQTDMVVLASGMVPTTKVENLEEAMQELAEQEATKEDSEKKDGEAADDKKEASCAEPGAKILNLAYRQGTDLPTLKYGYPDSNFICFPYETRRTAIYAAGTVRAPMDIDLSINDAYGAAMKSIQAVESINKGVAVHPRAGDMSFPDFFFQRCTQCKRCTEECPFGALDEDEKERHCRIRSDVGGAVSGLGACPERIISFKNYNINMMSQMIKAINVPDEFEEKPRILAFICENDALPSVDMAGQLRMQYNAMIRIIPLRCLGSMNVIWIADALSSGFDGVLLIGCKKGDDHQCHFVRGSELALVRMDNVRDKLKQLVLEEERVEIHELALTDYQLIPKIFDDFLEVIETVGPNPYKDM